MKIPKLTVTLFTVDKCASTQKLLYADTPEEPIAGPILACIITQCVLLKAGCATLNRKVCNIKFLR